MKAAALMLFTAILGVLSACDVGPRPEPPAIQQTHPAERARRATFLINPQDYSSTGTGFVVGRTITEDGSYLYHAITAYHVLDDVVDALKEKPDEASRKMELTFQPTLHGLAYRLNTELKDFEYFDEKLDWITFSFISEIELQTIEIADRVEFEQLEAQDIIYVLGCDAGFGVLIRRASIGSFNCITYRENSGSTSSWHDEPYKYFRPFTNIWFGASGGPVINNEGQVIGIINAVSVSGGPFGGNPVTHMTIVLKSYHILETIEQKQPELLAVADRR